MVLIAFNVRMNEGLRRQFNAPCSDFGMNATITFNVLARAVVREKRIPLEIQVPNGFTRQSGMQAFTALRVQAEENGAQDLSLDGTNEKIRKSRYGEATE